LPRRTLLNPDERAAGRASAAFIDTTAYYAFAAPRDREHAAAVALFSELARRRTTVYTTNLIVAETHVLLKSRLARFTTRQHALDTARTFIESIYASAVLIEPVTRADERRALALLATYRDQDFSFTDTASFAVMERLGIRHALAFDDDYVIAGFLAVRHTLR
jgi:predicted nucleic acid-binding protein